MKSQITQEQQRVVVGPGNAHCMSIRQVSLRAALAGSVLWPAAAAAAAAPRCCCYCYKEI